MRNDGTPRKSLGQSAHRTLQGARRTSRFRASALTYFAGSRPTARRFLSLPSYSGLCKHMELREYLCDKHESVRYIEWWGRVCKLEVSFCE